MSESMLQLIRILQLAWVVLCAGLYGYGGMIDKKLRRIGTSVLLTIGIVGFSLWMKTFNAWYILCALLYFASFSLGYGASSTLDKIKRRSIYGLAVAAACLPIVIVQSAWLLFGLHIALCVSVSVVLGVWNPIKDARGEETTIGFIAGFLPMMML